MYMDMDNNIKNVLGPIGYRKITSDLRYSPEYMAEGKGGRRLKFLLLKNSWVCIWRNVKLRGKMTLNQNAFYCRGKYILYTKLFVFKYLFHWYQI